MSGTKGTDEDLSVRKVRIAIDRGGTFTDCYATWQELAAKGEKEDKSAWKDCNHTLKLLSVDPHKNYGDAPSEGIRRLMEHIYKEEIPRGTKLRLGKLETIRMGTTVATNALLERKGARSALVTTQGFSDLLAIGDQTRPHLFDLTAKRPELLYSKVVAVDERVVPIGAHKEINQGGRQQDQNKIVTGISGEELMVLKEPNLKEVESMLIKLKEEDKIETLAICFLHSYLYPDHEKMVGNLAVKLGFHHVTCSSDLLPMIKAVPRAHSASLDAYLTPHTREYLAQFSDQFHQEFEGEMDRKLLLMQSDGGLAPAKRFSGLRSILSGPAGGVVGAGGTSFGKQAIIGLDMGGTSTDVSRFDGQYQHVFETTLAGVSILAPQLEILTVAAGGGSKLSYEGGLFKVGPQSVGANPGPLCYSRPNSESLAITDANLLLGRLQPELFPKLFGPNEDQPLDLEATQTGFSKLKEANEALKNHGLDEIAYGFIRVANEAMCRPIRNLTELKGWDSADHNLVSFGGAGGQHACSIANTLNIKTILIPHQAAILSAYGLSFAELVKEDQIPSNTPFITENYDDLLSRLDGLKSSVHQQLVSDEGADPDLVKLDGFFNMRYEGTDCLLMIPINDKSLSDAMERFLSRHQLEFGFLLSDRTVLVEDIRVRGSYHQSNSKSDSSSSVYEEVDNIIRKAPNQPPIMHKPVYFDKLGRVDTPIYDLKKLSAGDEVRGPSLIVEENSTVVVEPHWVGLMTSTHLYLTYDTPSASEEPQELSMADKPIDPIQLTIFANRFMGIAEQMGRTLQQTAVSTNIKERLDFSCALFGPDGELIANAPHIPVHLGSLSFAVKYQMEQYKNKWQLGDVIVTNHPVAGGSHLPDITVITPVLLSEEAGATPAFFVASRGHHADIGGILPGSMPPHSTKLEEEGVSILTYKLVRDHQFQMEGVKELFKDSRCLPDVISDLQAQVAANHKGITLMKQLIDQFGLESVQLYMHRIRSNASEAVRQLLRQFVPQGQSTIKLAAMDQMDDGSKIQLEITIHRDDGSAKFDFSGTGAQVNGNFNAPIAVTHSAILYCLRCMVQRDIPLNSGCLEPIEIHLPQGSILNPSPDAAVVGGNVTTSQRVCDVIFKAFKACAASQGCCNNLTFGKSGSSKAWGYYETIGGGAGAGPTWNGQSGTHTHMTNTRITDPEILERRYPLLLHQFQLRKGSGGHGKFQGGEGLIRELEFLDLDLKVSILSERRSGTPYGLQGGEPGKSGVNLLMRHINDDKKGKEADSWLGPTSFPEGWNGQPNLTLSHKNQYQMINLGGRATINVNLNDRLIVVTPGGGGYGTATEQ